MEEDKEQAIQLAKQNRSFLPNCWINNIHSKLLHCNKELSKWFATKKKMSKQELDDKVALLEKLQLHSTPNMAAIKRLEIEIDLWLAQEDVKWK